MTRPHLLNSTTWNSCLCSCFSSALSIPLLYYLNHLVYAIYPNQTFLYPVACSFVFVDPRFEGAKTSNSLCRQFGMTTSWLSCLHPQVRGLVYINMHGLYDTGNQTHRPVNIRHYSTNWATAQPCCQYSWDFLQNWRMVQAWRGTVEWIDKYA